MDPDGRKTLPVEDPPPVAPPKKTKTQTDTLPPTSQADSTSNDPKKEKQKNYTVFYDLNANELFRVESETSRTFIRTSTNNDKQAELKAVELLAITKYELGRDDLVYASGDDGSFFVEAPMPKAIEKRIQSNEDLTKDSKEATWTDHQRYDHLVAAHVAIFNYQRITGKLDIHDSTGYKIPAKFHKKIPFLDVTIIKSMIIQESHAGASGRTDLLTVNNPLDWKAKSSVAHYGIEKYTKLTASESLYYGIRVLASKGYKGGISVEYRDSGKTLVKTFNQYKNWTDAIRKFNGGGVDGYETYIEKQVSNSRKPLPTDYAY